jgi:LytS/YehU family sensor histidine kinase
MLVENAIKHGVSNLISGGEILIETKRNENSIVIRVSNTGKLLEIVDTGIGIQNTRRRLDLQYKGTVDFELREEGGNVVAEMIFNQ